MRLQTLEQQQPRMKGQLDILNRILHPSVQAYLRSHGSVPDMVLTKITGCVRNLRGRYSVYARPFLETTVKGPMKRGRSFVLTTADATFAGRV